MTWRKKKRPPPQLGFFFCPGCLLFCPGPVLGRPKTPRLSALAQNTQGKRKRDPGQKKSDPPPRWVFVFAQDVFFFALAPFWAGPKHHVFLPSPRTPKGKEKDTLGKKKVIPPPGGSFFLPRMSSFLPWPRFGQAQNTTSFCPRPEHPRAKKKRPWAKKK